MELDESKTNGQHLEEASSSNRTNGFANGVQRHIPPLRINTNEAAQSVSAPNIISSELYQVPGVKHRSDWVSLSQNVKIFEFSIEKQSFRVYTEIVLLPSDSSLSMIFLHLGQNALLPNEHPKMNGKITVDKIEASYRRKEPIANAISSNQLKCLSDIEPKIYNNIKENDYNLEVSIPDEVRKNVRLRKAIRVTIDIYVKQPNKGINFINSSTNKQDEDNFDEHAYTYHTPYISGTREWLPCLDEPDQLSLWDIQFDVDPKYVPVASGELVEKIHDPRKNVIQYQFTQMIPTSACNIGWAVARFNVKPHPESATILTFSLPGIQQFVDYTSMYLDKMMEFLEEKLSCRYAYPTLKVVFVDQTTEEINVYSSLLLISTNVLYHKKIIDVVQDVRQKLIFGIAQQFFGCFIAPSHWIYAWIMNSISKLLTNIYIENKLGLAESRWQIKRTMDDVCDYEHQWGKIVLSPELTDNQRINLHFDPRHEYTCSPLYVEIMMKKGFLTMRMLQKRLGSEPFLRVLHRMFTVGLEMSEKRSTPGAWKHLLTSTDAFFRSVSTVTGSEIPTFVEQWIKTGGHAAFAAKFEFNRKRNIIELEVKQDDSEGNGRAQYTGPLTVIVQEVDGAFSHTVQIDGATSHAELQCHSKGRKQKKKKIPTLSGEEIEFDLSNMDAESPVLWLRLDNDYLLIREINISQPIFHWEYMLKYERDVIAQMEALERIQMFPSAQSKSIIVDTVSNEKFFYRIRCRAAFVLSAVLNRKTEALTSGTPVLINMFRESYGSKASPNIPRPNNIVVTSQYLQQYFLQQALPQAIARLRKQTGELFDDVLPFLMDLIKFNDSLMNRYSDDYYRASLYNALASSIYPAECLPGRIEIPENLTSEIRSIIQEFTYALNMDTINPSYGRIVGIAALHGIYQLQKCGYLPLNSNILWMFTKPKVCSQLRRAAISLIVDRICNDPNASDVRLNDSLKLLEMAENDSDPSIRMMIPKLLAQTPPFATYNNTDFGFTNSCNTEKFVNKLWEMITNRKIDANVRSGISDLWFSLFGLGVPPVIGGPSEAPGHHRSYVTAISASTNLTTSGWHNSAYEAARRSPPRVNNFGDDSLM